MEARDQRPTDRSTYGRACTNCARNKCRCVIREASSRCERCTRLDKECRPSPTVRRRATQKQPISKTAQLEEKLDGLMSLFKAGTQRSGKLVGDIQANPAISDLDVSSILESCNTNSPSSVRSDRVGSISGQAAMTPGTSASSSTNIGSSADTYSCPNGPSSIEAEAWLTVFHTQHAKYFPFLHIPSTTTAEQLRQSRPFLWLCIMAVSSKIMAQQQALNKQIRHIVSQRILHDSEYSLDLLLGLLTHIGWSNLQVHNKPNLSLYTQLAVSMVFDLNLNKPNPQSDRLILCTYTKRTYTSLPRSMEEQRAVLGSFLITSIISAFVQKIDALRWTPYMDECLSVLNDTPESLNDVTLVQQVRLQLVIEKVGNWQEGGLQNSGLIRAPPSFYFQALQSQLQEITADTSFSSGSNEILLTHLYITNLIINEAALAQVPTIANDADFQRLECLYSCLNSVNAWFGVFFTISPAEYIGFPFSIFSQLSHCLITLYKLSSLEDPSWPVSEVRKTADILSILDKVIDNMSSVPALSGLDCDAGEDVFTRTAERFRSIKVGWEAKLSADLMMPITEDGQNAGPPFPYDLSMTFSETEWPAVDDWMSDLFTAVKS